MDEVIPINNIRRKYFETNRNRILSEQQNMSFPDTSSDYNPNFIDLPSNKISLFDQRKIREYFEDQIDEKANSIKRENLSPLEKRLMILDEMNTSTDSDDKIYNDDSDSTYDEISTRYSSYSLLNQSDEKVKYYIEYKLYDNISDYNNKNKIKLPQIVQIDEGKFYYFYLNTLKTHFYTKSAFLGDSKSIIEENYDLDECKLNESLGLFFCGKTIEYNNEKTICAPNTMICKKCMEKNKKRYNLGNKYLININGRAAKKIQDGDKDKGFHCFGHFLIDNKQMILSAGNGVKLPKFQTPAGPIEKSDNTSVQRPTIVRPIRYKLKPREFFYTDPRTGKKYLMHQKEE